MIARFLASLIFYLTGDSSFVGAVNMAKTVKLMPIDETPVSFAEFGQVISASYDGQKFGPLDAQLELHRGIPSASGDEWYLGVAKSSILEGAEFNDGKLRASIQSKCGHYYMPPHLDDVHIFRVTGTKFLKLNRGTWHAGPLFKRKTMDFYNLELSDTNVVDHTTHDFLKHDGVALLVWKDN